MRKGLINSGAETVGLSERSGSLTTAAVGDSQFVVNRLKVMERAKLPITSDQDVTFCTNHCTEHVVVFESPYGGFLQNNSSVNGFYLFMLS